MKNRTLKILIKSHALIIAITGLIAMMFFYPSPHGCSDFNACLPYSLTGVTLLIMGAGLFLLNNLARKCMLWFSLAFVGFFIFETTWLIMNDFTGQGLVGMMLLVPIFLICLLGLFFWRAKKVKNTFNGR